MEAEKKQLVVEPMLLVEVWLLDAELIQVGVILLKNDLLTI